MIADIEGSSSCPDYAASAACKNPEFWCGSIVDTRLRVLYTPSA